MLALDTQVEVSVWLHEIRRCLMPSNTDLMITVCMISALEVLIDEK